MPKMLYLLKIEQDSWCEIEGSFASGDDECDRQDVAGIQQRLKDGDEWASFSACVIVECGSFTGESRWLCGCSYESEEDFRESDYYKDMQREARKDLLEKLKEAAELYQELLAQEKEQA